MEFGCMVPLWFERLGDGVGEAFFHILESQNPLIEDRDRMSWCLRLKWDFDIKSFYGALPLVRINCLAHQW